MGTAGGFSFGSAGTSSSNALTISSPLPASLAATTRRLSVFAPQWRDRAVTADEHGELRVWNVAEARLERTVKSPADARPLALDPRGRFVAAKPIATWPPRTLVLFDLAAPPSAEPTLLLAGEDNQLDSLSFSPDGAWLATTHDGIVILWHTAGVRPVVLGRHDPANVTVAFTLDGRLLPRRTKGLSRAGHCRQTAVSASGCCGRNRTPGRAATWRWTDGGDSWSPTPR